MIIFEANQLRQNAPDPGARSKCNCVRDGDLLRERVLHELCVTRGCLDGDQQELGGREYFPVAAHEYQDDSLV